MVVKGEINVDLQNERKKCNFNIEELTNYLDDDAGETKRRRSLEEKVLSIKGLIDVVPEEYLSHKEKYENAVKKAVLFHRNMPKPDLDSTNAMENVRKSFRNFTSQAVFKEGSPFMLHFSMFMPTIAGQGTDEQKAYWLERAAKMEILGTYAQTELGHGTFVRGLETRATYDPKTEEFILHSPALSSYKWWPGGLAHTANYCIVMAQLYVKGKHCGMQTFLVQIRDEATHMPLPGIKLGEIGAKLGFNTVNNGFLGFDNHRIPRDRMLMKNSQVTKDGEFKASPHSKLAYGTMVFVRVTIVYGSANQLAKAATIATRYSAVRHQSKPKENEPEPQIIEYLTQQHKLFIAIASSYVFTIVAKHLWDIYMGVTSDLSRGNMETLPELHSLACCLKAVSSSDCAAMIEKLRQSCGGHGYMLSSNLPQIYGFATASCTYEGENTVLMLQTARSLVKAYEQAENGKPLSPTMAYLADKSRMPRWENSPDMIIKGFQKIAAGKVSSCVANMKRYMKTGMPPEDAWNMTSVQLVNAAEAHCRAVILATLKSELDKTTTRMSGPTKKALYTMMELYMVYWALEKTGDLLLYTSISENDLQQLQLKYETLLGEMRPNAVGLVDAFDIRDEFLQSTLGAYDGRVYERLMEEALKSPLNAEPVNRSFHTHLKPFMQGKL